VRHISAALFAFALLLGACGDDGGDPTDDATESEGNGGGGGNGSGGGNDRDSAACDLLTDDEVDDALGQPVRETQGEDGVEGQQRCTWILESDDVDVLTVVIYDDDTSQAVFESVEGDEVGDVGEAATWSPDLRTLYTLVDGRTVMVQIVVDPPLEGEIGVASDLTESIIDRL
jgi:hypothetical protein